MWGWEGWAASVPRKGLRTEHGAQRLVALGKMSAISVGWCQTAKDPWTLPYAAEAASFPPRPVPGP